LDQSLNKNTLSFIESDDKYVDYNEVWKKAHWNIAHMCHVYKTNKRPHRRTDENLYGRPKKMPGNKKVSKKDEL
jgi:hypothetical protein